MKKLELYYFKSCPYCRKVMSYIKENGLQSKIVLHNTVEDAAAEARLVEMNGDDQVPCLVIDGKPMLESEDIIEWLGKNALSI